MNLNEAEKRRISCKRKSEKGQVARDECSWQMWLGWRLKLSFLGRSILTSSTSCLVYPLAAQLPDINACSIPGATSTDTDYESRNATANTTSVGISLAT